MSVKKDNEVMYATIQEIKQANKRKGGNWFDKSTMEFFASQINNKVYHGKFFITSEQFEATDYQKERYGWTDGPRKFSVRMCKHDGSIETIGEHMKFTSLQEAELAIEEVMMMEGKYLLPLPGDEYQYKVFLAQTVTNRVKEHMDYLSTDGHERETYSMFVSGCEVFVWQMTEERFYEALSYLQGYGFEKCSNRPQLKS